MFRKIGVLFSAVLILVAASGAFALPHGVATKKTSAHVALPTGKARVAHTPMDRLLLPVLQKRLAASAAKGKPISLARPEAAGVSTVLPNFGGFMSPPFYPARLEASCITDPYNCGVAFAVPGDFNKDGSQDVAVMQYDGTLNILLGNGSGSFAAPVVYSNPNVSTTEIQQGFVVDVNNDGYPDILAFDAGNNAIIVYLNLKNGTFSSPIASGLTSANAIFTAIAIGDVNGDGNQDVVGITSDSNLPSSTIIVSTYLGSGNGNFQKTTTALTQSISIPSQVEFASNEVIALGDVNGDGKLDIAAEFEEYTSQTSGQFVISVAMGKGDGSFAALNVNDPITAPFNSQGFPFFALNSAGVQIVDLNGDSKPDLAVDVNAINNPAALIVALGDGSGNFKTTVQTPNVAASQQISYVDVNGDGVPDLIQSNGLLNIWIGKGDGTFSQSANGASYIEDSNGAQSLALADFNGDGNLDIAQLGGDYKQLSFFAGNGKGSFYGTPALASSTDTDPAPLYIELNDVADVQGKGYTSAIYIDDSGAAPQEVTGVSDGKGNFTYVVGLTATADPTLGFIEPVQVDFNGDGLQDLLIAGTDGSLAVALSKGDGTFAAPQKLALPALDCELNYAATGDLNGDKKADIVVAYVGDSACGGTGGTGSGYFVAQGNGDGTFKTPVFNAYGSELYSVTLADMNLDGNLDLLIDDAPFQTGGTFAIDLLPGNGDGTFAQGTTVNSGFMVSQVIPGDYNGDGKPDLILLQEGEQTDQDYLATAGVFLVSGNGDFTFNAASQLVTGNFFLNGSLTDVNGDGIPDLVLALYSTIGQPNTFYGLSTMLGEGGGAFSAPINSLESLDSESVFPGNFFADNAPDFIVDTAYGTGLYLGQGGTTLTLTDSGASIVFGQSDTLTATVAASIAGRPAPSGTVSFWDGTTLLGVSSISSGTATLSSATLAVGTHSITAAYSGDGNFNPQTTSATQVVVTTLTPAFTLAAAQSTMSLKPGQDGVGTLNLTANASFSGDVALSCSGAPANATCTVNPASVTLVPGGASTATLVVSTTTASSALKIDQAPGHNSNGSGSPVSLALAAFGLVAGWRWRKRFPMLFSMLILAFVGLSLTACGNGNSVPTAAGGSYTLTVTATPASGSATAQTVTVAVTVQ
jgi:Bacterial Ig-like domain (group 3)/FG-GAP-like repeat